VRAQRGSSSPPLSQLWPAGIGNISLRSRDKPTQNADGSTDLYLGPKALPGKDANWLATVPDKGYFAIIRLYGPTEAALTQELAAGDIEKMQ